MKIRFACVRFVFGRFPLSDIVRERCKIVVDGLCATTFVLQLVSWAFSCSAAPSAVLRCCTGPSLHHSFEHDESVVQWVRRSYLFRLVRFSMPRRPRGDTTGHAPPVPPNAAAARRRSGAPPPQPAGSHVGDDAAAPIPSQPALSADAAPPPAVAPSTTVSARTIGNLEAERVELTGAIRRLERQLADGDYCDAAERSFIQQRISVKDQPILELQKQITALTSRLPAATTPQPAPPGLANSLTLETLRGIAARATSVPIHAHLFGKLRSSLLRLELLKSGQLLGTIAGRIVPLDPKVDPMRVFVDRVRDLSNAAVGADKSLIPHMAVVGIGGMGKTELLRTIQCLGLRINPSAHADHYWTAFQEATTGATKGDGDSSVRPEVKEVVVMFATFNQGCNFKKKRDTETAIAPRTVLRMINDYFLLGFKDAADDKRLLPTWLQRRCG